MGDEGPGAVDSGGSGCVGQVLVDCPLSAPITTVEALLAHLFNQRPHVPPEQSIGAVSAVVLLPFVNVRRRVCRYTRIYSSNEFYSGAAPFTYFIHDLAAPSVVRTVIDNRLETLNVVKQGDYVLRGSQQELYVLSKEKIEDNFIIVATRASESPASDVPGEVSIFSLKAL